MDQTKAQVPWSTLKEIFIFGSISAAFPELSGPVGQWGPTQG